MLEIFLAHTIYATLWNEAVTIYLSNGDSHKDSALVYNVRNVDVAEHDYFGEREGRQ